MSAPLGRLERVELRDVWLSEAQDFTPGWRARTTWPSSPKRSAWNWRRPRRRSGRFVPTFFCKDVADTDNRLVLIENQLERTDHRHLGQLITYAAGLEAVTIIWVAVMFDEQHRAALAC